MSTYLKLLGRPSVEDGGRVTVLPPERRCLLLLVLALRRSWVERSELAALLWPGHHSALAAANLRKAVHLARALPWARALEVQPSLLRFAVPTDLHAIEQARREGRRAEALALCRGGLLDGMDDAANPAWSTWLDAERDQHASQLHALTRAHLAHLEAPLAGPARATNVAQATQCAAFARELLAADALDEDAVCALLRAQTSLGEHAAQRETYRAFAARLRQELGVEPALRVRALLVQAAPVQAALPTHGAFVGRTRELDELAALLARDECRLLTVLGPGGVGKSTLLKRALQRVERGFADGACWIALDDLHDLPQTAARIAGELKLAPGPQQEPAALLCEHLASRCTLLVFDNAEHIAGLPLLIERLLAAAPRLKVCATSRVRLGAAGEWLLPLGGLVLPALGATTHEVLGSDAARLFVAAAGAARPDFTPQQQATPIAALLHATGGLPLAILLAASWVRHLPVAEIVQELQASLAVLDSGSDAGDERPEHRSMQATFERSWQLLSGRERHTLAALSVFAGSFTRQAALDVAGAALPLLAALADKSLLQWEAGGRCALHPLIRSFAAQALPEPARAEALRRHAAWYQRLLAQIDRTIQAAGVRGFDEAEAEIENCRGAWRWAVAQGQPDAVGAGALVLIRWFDLRGRTLEALLMLREAQAALCSGANPPAACAARLGAAVAYLESRLYRVDEAAASARAALVHARAAANRSARMFCLMVLGMCHWQWGRQRQSRRFYEQALRDAHATGDAAGAASLEGNMAHVDTQLGNHAAAEASLQRLLTQGREWRDWTRVAGLLNNLAVLQQDRCEWPAAAASLDEALVLCERHPGSGVRPYLLVNRALVSYRLADDAAAQRFARTALETARGASNRYIEATALMYLARVALRALEFVAAHAHVCEAVAPALVLRNPALLLDALLLFALLHQARGDAAAAAPLLHIVLASPDAEASLRAEAQAGLARLPARLRRDAAPPTEIDSLLQRAAAEAGVALPH